MKKKRSIKLLTTSQPSTTLISSVRAMTYTFSALTKHYHSTHSKTRMNQLKSQRRITTAM